MTVIINSKLGESRGNKRIWIEGNRLARGGFEAGTRYALKLDKGRASLQVCEQGTYTVSKRQRNGKITPIVDLNNEQITKLFDGIEMLRILIRDGKIIITGHHQQQRVTERETRLLTKIANKTKLAVASLFHGGGVLDKAFHHGLAMSGVGSAVRLAVELEGDYVDSSLQNNPELWDNDSLVINGGIETIDMMKTNDIQVDILLAGIPCTGASRAGRSKNGLGAAEEHDAAGAMFFHFLQFVQRLNPAVVLIENVPDYSNTTSMTVIRSVLASLGYRMTERTLNGNEFGALENRNRLCAVAVSEGIEGFDMEQVEAVTSKPDNLAEILEDVALDSKSWRTFDYLATKEEKDLAAGKGFKRQLLTPDADQCGTIGRGYAKCRSTEPFLKHPTDPKLSRIFTPLEHARVKGIPAEVVSGMSATKAHEILGQSVIYPAFVAVGRALASFLQGYAGAAPAQQAA